MPNQMRTQSSNERKDATEVIADSDSSNYPPVHHKNDVQSTYQADANNVEAEASLNESPAPL